MDGSRSLVDVITPAEGFRFKRGIWLTHDLNVGALNELVLPVLAGIGALEASATACAPGRLDEGALTILAAGDVIDTAGQLPARAVKVMPVLGRRQHAKVLMLLYERVVPEASPARSLLLSVVTSANLTKPGLSTNREVYAAEKVYSNSGGQVIALPLLDALTELARHQDTVRHTQDRIEATRAREGLLALLAQLRDALPGRARPADGVVAHSLARTPSKARSLPRQLLTQSADRVILIGPAFADDDSDVLPLVGPAIGAHTQVDLVVDTSASSADLAQMAKVQVPTRLRTSLDQRAGGSLRVHAAATDDARSSTARVLHGKQIVAITGSTATAIVGSANLTRRGLAGQNRELVVLVSIAGTADLLLAELNAVPLEESQMVGKQPHRDPLPEKVAIEGVPLIVTFTAIPEQRNGQALLRGVIDGLPPGVDAVVDGVPVIPGSVIEIPRDARIQTSQGRPILLQVEGVSYEVPLDIAPPRLRDPWLVLLTRDVQIATTRPPRPPGPRNGHHSNSPDGFFLPPNVRLNVLARHRRALRHLDPEVIDGVLCQLFPDPVERSVANTIVDATLGKSGERPPILAALGQTLAATAGAAR